jgi:hypothetical protein
VLIPPAPDHARLPPQTRACSAPADLVPPETIGYFQSPPPVDRHRAEEHGRYYRTEEGKEMAAQQSETAKAEGFLIESTGQAKSAQFSDISMTGLFNAHIATINSERQAIWQRYNIMVFANSIIFSLSVSGITEYGTETITGAAVGLVLCVIWWSTFKSGLQLYELWNENAAKFAWQGLDENVNPHVISRKWRENLRGFQRTAGGPVYFGGVLTILIFALGYVGLLAMEGYDQWQALQHQAAQSSCVRAG